MTNKEKAHQIAWEDTKHYDPICCKQEWVEMGAIDMAAWKEQQIIEALEKLIEEAEIPHKKAIYIIEGLEKAMKKNK